MKLIFNLFRNMLFDNLMKDSVRKLLIKNYYIEVDKGDG